METPYTKRVQRFLEEVLKTSRANEDQVILRTSTPGAPMLTLDDIRKAVQEMEMLFIAAEEAGYLGKQLAEHEYLH